MKTLKRNAVIVTVVLFVCAAVYLNWSYNQQVKDASEAGSDDRLSTLEEKPGSADASPGTGEDPATAVPDQGAGLYYTVNGGDKQDSPDTSSTGDDAQAPTASGDYAEYFAQVRLERSQARDEASATLQAVAQADGASKDTVDGALNAMTELARNAVKESELESQIRSKGFIDCVVYLSEGGARVTVAAEGGLNQASVAKITDIMSSQGGIPASKLTVTEIK